jgi:hypothetical protein
MKIVVEERNGKPEGKRSLEKYVLRWADNIVTYRVVRVTKLTDSSSDDWIYWHFGYKFS